MFSHVTQLQQRPSDRQQTSEALSPPSPSDQFKRLNIAIILVPNWQRSAHPLQE